MVQSVLKPSIKYGIYLGLFMCTFIVFMWVTRLDTTYYHIGKNLEIAVSVIPIAVILYAIHKLNQKQDLTVSKRLIAGITVGLVSVAVSTPFIEIYHHFINPEWFDAVLHLQEQKMISEGATETEITTRLERMRAGDNTFSSVLSAFISGGILFPAVVSLASTIFIRNKQDINQD